MIELRGGLVVLGCPGLAAIGGNGGAAVIAIDHALRIIRINPQAVVIAMRRGQQIKGASAIGRAEHSGVEHIKRVERFRIGKDMGEVPGPLADAAIFTHANPILTAII